MSPARSPAGRGLGRVVRVGLAPDSGRRLAGRCPAQGPASIRTRVAGDKIEGGALRRSRRRSPADWRAGPYAAAAPGAPCSQSPCPTAHGLRGLGTTRAGRDGVGRAAQPPWRRRRAAARVFAARGGSDGSGARQGAVGQRPGYAALPFGGGLGGRTAAVGDCADVAMKVVCKLARCSNLRNFTVPTDGT